MSSSLSLFCVSINVHSGFDFAGARFGTAILMFPPPTIHSQLDAPDWKIAHWCETGWWHLGTGRAGLLFLFLPLFYWLTVAREWGLFGHPSPPPLAAWGYRLSVCWHDKSSGSFAFVYRINTLLRIGTSIYKLIQYFKTNIIPICRLVFISFKRYRSTKVFFSKKNSESTLTSNK